MTGSQVSAAAESEDVLNKKLVVRSKIASVLQYAAV